MFTISQTMISYALTNVKKWNLIAKSYQSILRCTFTVRLHACGPAVALYHSGRLPILAVCVPFLTAVAV